MSLFDVLRYPINDIYNNPDLEQIPDSILVPWLVHWMKITDYKNIDLSFAVDHPTYCLACKDYCSAFVVSMIDNCSLDLRHASLLKSIMTKDLRKRIAEYDQE